MSQLSVGWFERAGAAHSRVMLSLLLVLLACGEAHPVDRPDSDLVVRDAGPHRRDAGPGDAGPIADRDGDGIPDTIEDGEGGVPIDTDADGIPDGNDLDSDGDTIHDRDEGAADVDRDAIPNFRDLDSDGDGRDDAVEAGDADLVTPPVECANEVDPISGRIASDMRPDAYDPDSDNDGVDDRSEAVAGTNVCSIDSDADGFTDGVEVEYSRLVCPDGSTGIDCDCATNPSCGLPAEDLFAVLPYGGEPVVRQLAFGAVVSRADVLFLVDTTAGAAGTISAFRAAGMAVPLFGGRIGAVIGDVELGLATHDDVPISPYGSGASSDTAYSLVAPVGDPSAIGTAFTGLAMHGGADAPESATVALYEIGRGAGGTWTSTAGSFSIAPSMCAADRRGGACFRSGALPVILHFTESCHHNGPAGGDPACDEYSGFAPPIADFTTAAMSLRELGARYVGVNTSGEPCAAAASPISPCRYMLEMADETGTADYDGNPWSFDLPLAPTAREFEDTVITAIDAALNGTRFDLSTAVRDDAGDSFGVDATRFIKRRRPACTGAPGDTACWTEPVGIEHDDAVQSIDTATFFGLIPGTVVTFDITLQNDFHEGSAEARAYVAYIDLVTAGGVLIDTRSVFIVVAPSGSRP